MGGCVVGWQNGVAERWMLSCLSNQAPSKLLPRIHPWSSLQTLPLPYPRPPRKVEPFTQHSSLKRVLDALSQRRGYRLASVHLVDAHLCTEPSK